MRVFNSIKDRQKSGRFRPVQDFIGVKRIRFGDMTENTLVSFAFGLAIHPGPFLKRDSDVFLARFQDYFADARISLTALDGYTFYAFGICPDGFGRRVDSIY